MKPVVRLRFELQVWDEEGHKTREDHFDRDLDFKTEHYIAAVESYWRELGDLLAPGIVSEFGRLRSIAAKKTDPIIMEVQYGAITPTMKDMIETFFHHKGFENFRIMEVAPGRGPVKWSIIQEKEAQDE